MVAFLYAVGLTYYRTDTESAVGGNPTAAV